MMAYSPLLLTSDLGWSAVLVAGLITMAMMVAVAVCIEGYLFTHADKASRIACLGIAGLLVYPNDISRMIGFIFAFGVFTKNYYDSLHD
jgi:TRAP-type uncharacterized transport system fused permease subunit